MKSTPLVARRKSGFTLIELLVVIAIIGLLAAILFPAFARVRENAKRSSCLSNTKQLNIAMMQYTQDYDETTPISYNASAVYTDVWLIIQPYIKSKQVLNCPSYSATDCLAAYGNIDGRCPGYGYNFGPLQTFIDGVAHGGLISSYTSGVFKGVKLSQIASPSETWVFGDARDWAATGFTFSGILALSAAGDKTMTHDGRLSVAFADGHSKSVQFRAGKSSLSSTPVALPRKISDYSSWCAEPDKLIYTAAGDKPCKDVGAYLETTMTQWY